MTTRNSRWNTLALACVLTATLGAGPAWANKPEWAGQGKGGKHGERHEGKHGGPATAAPVTIGGYFAEPQPSP